MRNSTPPSVKYNIERDKTMPESIRKSELASVDSVDVIDPLTVRFNLKKPDSTLLAALTDRAGMMVAPEAAKQAGAKFGLNPVCSGPYKFVERVQQDHITLARNPNYWNAKAFSFDKIVFRTIPDSTARLASLRSGDLDIAERVEPTDVKELQAQKDFKVVGVTSLGYQGLTVNVANGPASKVRRRPGQARSPGALACDRPARRDGRGLRRAVRAGLPGRAAGEPLLFRQVSDRRGAMSRKAKALLKAAGRRAPGHQCALHHLLARAKGDGGRCRPWRRKPEFELKLISTEFATQMKVQTDGDYRDLVHRLVGTARSRRQHLLLLCVRRRPQRQPLLQ